jgi:hypothetical protein
MVGHRTARVCLIGANEEETEARTRLGAFIWCWTAPRHDADEGGITSERGEEEHGVVLSAMREEKMRTSSYSIFWTKGYAGWVGLLLDCVVGGLHRGLHGQVSPFLFSLLFSIYNSVFSFYLNFIFEFCYFYRFLNC